MSAGIQSIATQEAATREIAARDSLLSRYAELTKPRVTSLVVATAWCGYFMGAIKSHVPSFSWPLLHTLLGIGIVAGGAAALNQVIERETDARMRRTQRRPLPSRRMRTVHAALFGLALVAGGSIYLAFATNPLTGYLAFATAAAYLLFYTPLKHVTS